MILILKIHRIYVWNNIIFVGNFEQKKCRFHELKVQSENQRRNGLKGATETREHWPGKNPASPQGARGKIPQQGKAARVIARAAGRAPHKASSVRSIFPAANARPLEHRSSGRSSHQQLHAKFNGRSSFRSSDPGAATSSDAVFNS